MLTRAYSLLTIKSVDTDHRIITGIATSASTDRQGDIVEVDGAEFQLPIPLLWQHDARQPIGEVFAARATKAGIEIKARIAKIEEPGTLKDRLDEAWQALKYGLVKGLSIGFKSLEDVDIKGTTGVRFVKWLWLELSAVTIPANQDASIHTIKQFDIGLAASGTSAPVVPPTSGVTDIHRVVKTQTSRTMKKSYADQISSFEATRQAKNAEMDTIMATAGDEGVTLDEAQKTTYDTLEEEVKSIDEHLKRLRAAEERSKAAAIPVNGDTAEKASQNRGGQVITVTRKLPPGIRFTRAAMCIAAAKGSRGDAIALAKEAYPDDPDIQHYITKTAVGAATTANHQGPDLQYTDFMGDFVEYQRPGSIIGKFGQNGIPALRTVPFNTRVSTQTAGGSAYWVGQGLPKPLTKATFGTITIDFTKVACISVLTQEEVRFANPSAEAKVRDDLAAAVNARIDQDFIDPANAGTANVKPASITNGVVASAVSGIDSDAVSVDFSVMMQAFNTANISVTSGVWIMSSQIALNLSLMLNAFGQRVFPDLAIGGGRLFGFPVITSEYLAGLGSPSTGMVVFANASDIYLADDGNVAIQASGEASLEMLDSTLLQDGTIGTGAALVSLWQNNLLGLRAERFINWKKRRAQAVQYLSPVAYAPQT